MTLSELRTENGLTTDIFVVECTGRGLVVKRPGVLSKVQMLNLVLGVWGSLGVPERGCFKPGCLQILGRSALLRSYAPFCALLRFFADLRLRSFALICVFLRLTPEPPKGVGKEGAGNLSTDLVSV